jgi:hypothetical protein
MLDHSFTLQAIMEVQKTIGDLTAKTERLISDVAGHGTKIDGIRHQIAFVKGALWVIGALVVISSTAIGLYLRYSH